MDGSAFVRHFLGTRADMELGAHLGKPDARLEARGRLPDWHGDQDVAPQGLGPLGRCYPLPVADDPRVDRRPPVPHYGRTASVVRLK